MKPNTLLFAALIAAVLVGAKACQQKDQRCQDSLPCCAGLKCDDFGMGTGIGTCQPNTPAPPGGSGDPEFIGMNAASSPYRFDGYKGAVFNLFTEKDHLFNSKFDRMAGPDSWPYWGTWMIAYGFRYADVLDVEVHLDNTKHYAVDPLPDGTHAQRMLLPGGNFSDVLRVKINDQDYTHALETGVNVLFQKGGSVFFPPREAKHANDPTDGPVLASTTPRGLNIIIQMETEDVLHLDFSIKLTSKNITLAHGVLGQTMHWTDMSYGKVEGTDADYEVKDGLLGTDFKYNYFGTATNTVARKLAAGEVAVPDDGVYNKVSGGLEAIPWHVPVTVKGFGVTEAQNL